MTILKKRASIGAIVQLVERLFCMQDATRSSRVSSSSLITDIR